MWPYYNYKLYRSINPSQFTLFSVISVSQFQSLSSQLPICFNCKNILIKTNNSKNKTFTPYDNSYLFFFIVRTTTLICMSKVHFSCVLTSKVGWVGPRRFSPIWLLKLLNNFHTFGSFPKLHPSFLRKVRLKRPIHI